jgi:hypothetical protein
MSVDYKGNQKSKDRKVLYSVVLQGGRVDSLFIVVETLKHIHSYTFCPKIPRPLPPACRYTYCRKSCILTIGGLSRMTSYLQYIYSRTFPCDTRHLVVKNYEHLFYTVYSFNMDTKKVT